MSGAAALEALVAGTHGDPFSLLGPHLTDAGWVLRALLPGARGVAAHAPDGALIAVLERAHPDGLFVGEMPGRLPYRLRIDWASGEQETADPYAFPPLLGGMDIYLIAEGRHRRLAEALGAHAMTIDGVSGVRFAVWAPNARRVSVVGDHNGWDGRRHPMRLRIEAGVWELFVPGLGPGARYKYELIGFDGTLLPLKADPCAGQAEHPPATASVVPAPLPPHPRIGGPALSADAPVSIYEVHLGSWMRGEGGRALTWDELAERLVPYARDLGFTHLELLPITEFPFDGSWGYQPIGMFAPTSRFGPPEGFRRFVDRAHEAGIGVILDWVPAHFPTDAHGLAQFDGTHLYEHADPREGFHQDWSTLIYNLGRHEVRGFLIASALTWLRDFGCDGLRVDAVASLLYRDYSRKHGEWVPNIHGGRENLEAIGFLRELNEAVTEHAPWASVIAEESTAWPGVTAPVAQGGLGFRFKWNMGWMNDTLDYVSHDPVHRPWHHDKLTFGLLYGFSERFILPLSHDEVVHGKRSLLGRMPGDAWQRFATLRAYFGFMWGHPGKKLLFMGGELAQPDEWNHEASLPWHLRDHPAHAGVSAWVRDLNGLLAATPSLYRNDASPAGFSWSVVDDREHSTYAFCRYGDPGDAPALVISNFTPVPRPGYRVGVPRPGLWAERLNSDSALYGGSNMGNGGGVPAEDVPVHGHAQSLVLTLPPLATLILVHAP
ncbi:1,4-alpha-glucan branching protein GlgB [Elioraea sp.]|uniref:1,4-alpha-glucan branching protein GlgB n=1 Tax=Elioraea sp. TaxID=2185103 RepID=UPI0025C0BEF4|nr:1,4-alpha-glucan branching protein GlgB [Elioraea sp.]